MGGPTIAGVELIVQYHNRTRKQAANGNPTPLSVLMKPKEKEGNNIWESSFSRNHTDYITENDALSVPTTYPKTLAPASVVSKSRKFQQP